jgi:hypothetical protein
MVFNDTFVEGYVLCSGKTQPANQPIPIINVSTNHPVVLPNSSFIKNIVVGTLDGWFDPLTSGALVSIGTMNDPMRFFSGLSTNILNQRVQKIWTDQPHFVFEDNTVLTASFSKMMDCGNLIVRVEFATF